MYLNNKNSISSCDKTTHASCAENISFTRLFLVHLFHFKLIWNSCDFINILFDFKDEEKELLANLCEIHAFMRIIFIVTN